jgi:hypothetical protein
MNAGKSAVSVFFILACSILSLFGQEESKSRDKFSLLTMAYNKRPLLLYKGQLQINTSYKFGTRTKSFDSDGKRISLKDKGSASIIHTYILELRYGITDFIELGVNSYYLRNGIRSETGSILSGSDMITTNRLDEYKGMGDMNIMAALRLPFEYKLYDFSVRGGITLPTAKYKPSEPSHTITDYTSPDNFTINYNFNNKNGTGVIYYNLAVSGKFSVSKISFEINGLYRFPSKEQTSYRWDWSRSGSAFTYYPATYRYLPGRNLIVNGSIHYQAAGFFDLFLGGIFNKTSLGWTEYYGNKYANPEASLITLEPGFELQIAPSLTIYQYAGFQLSGKNSDAPFYLLTTLSFNMFPFWK